MRLSPVSIYSSIFHILYRPPDTQYFADFKKVNECKLARTNASLTGPPATTRCPPTPAGEGPDCKATEAFERCNIDVCRDIEPGRRLRVIHGGTLKPEETLQEFAAREILEKKDLCSIGFLTKRENVSNFIIPCPTLARNREDFRELSRSDGGEYCRGCSPSSPKWIKNFSLLTLLEMI